MLSAPPKGIVVSLFDYTGVAVRPWAERGYVCLTFDLQHEARGHVEERVGAGFVCPVYWDSDRDDAITVVERKVAGIRWAAGNAALPVVMVYGFPPCTDLAVSGARHWAKKLAADPLFQVKAAARATLCETIANRLGNVPYVVENPAGALSRLWRKADHSFNPSDYGRYIGPQDAEHPLWPAYIPPRDAYTKRTLLWVGNGFVMPGKRSVEPIIVEFDNGKRGSPQWAKLGGKSMKTKNIRSATPRGFAVASFRANAN